MKYLGLKVSEFMINENYKFSYPGDKGYLLFPYRGRYSFVCETTIKEVELVLLRPGDTQSIWVWVRDDLIIRNYDGTVFLGKGYVIHNEFLTIDEPVGHAVSFDAYDGLFKTLEEALKFAHPWKGCKHRTVRKALKRMRFSRLSWIIHTHYFDYEGLNKKEKVLQEAMLHTNTLRDKKVWVRRK